jgi:hypothetical protein
MTRKQLLISAFSLAILTTIAHAKEVEVYNESTNTVKYYDVVKTINKGNKRTTVIYDYDKNTYTDYTVKTNNNKSNNKR